MDRQLLEEFKARLADRYTPEELTEKLGLTEYDILDMFEEKVVELVDE